MGDQMRPGKLIARWGTLVVGVVALGAAPPAAQHETDVKAATTLRQAAADRLLVGAAVSRRAVEDPKLAAILAEQFNCLTAENAMKRRSLSGQPLPSGWRYGWLLTMPKASINVMEPTPANVPERAVAGPAHSGTSSLMTVSFWSLVAK